MQSPFKVHPPKAQVRRLAKERGYSLTKHLTNGESVRWLLLSPNSKPIVNNSLHDTLLFLNSNDLDSATSIFSGTEYSRWLWAVLPQQLITLGSKHFVAPLWVPITAEVRCEVQTLEIRKTSLLGYAADFSESKTLKKYEDYISFHKLPWFSHEPQGKLKIVQEFLEAQYDGQLGF